MRPISNRICLTIASPQTGPKAVDWEHLRAMEFEWTRQRARNRGRGERVPRWMRIFTG